MSPALARRVSPTSYERASGWLHLYGACHPYGQRLPLAAIADAIADASGIGPARWSGKPPFARCGDSPGDALAGSPGAAIASLVRQLETILGLHDGSAGGRRGGTPGGAALDAQRGRASRSIRALAAGRPTLFALDDVQWADPDLLHLLEGIDRGPWPEPVLFLALARPEPEAWHRRLTTIRLGALPGRTPVRSRRAFWEETCHRPLSAASSRARPATPSS